MHLDRNLRMLAGEGPRELGDRSSPCRRQRRRGHQVAYRNRHRPPRHHRHRPRGHVRQRSIAAFLAHSDFSLPDTAFEWTLWIDRGCFCEFSLARPHLREWITRPALPRWLGTDRRHGAATLLSHRFEALASISQGLHALAKAAHLRRLSSDRSSFRTSMWSRT